MAKKVSLDKGKTVQWYFEEKAGDWQAEVLTQLHELITRFAPDAEHGIKWSQPVYSSNGPFAFMRSAKKHVTLGFWRGAELDDPEGLLQGDGNKMKHIKLMENAEIPVAAVESYVNQALTLNAEKGDPTKNK